MKNNNIDNTIIDSHALQDVNFDSLLNGDNTIHEISTSGDLLLINECSESHKTIKTVFKKKFDSLKVIYKWWSEGNLSSVINAVKIMKDKIIMNDFFNYAFLKNDVSNLPFTFDLVSEILSMSIKLCQDKYESYIRTGLETNYVILGIFKKNLLPNYIKNINERRQFDENKVLKIKEQIEEIKNLEIIHKVKEKKYNEEIYNITLKLFGILEEI